MVTNRSESDFWVTFGSNAREFSTALPGNLKGAREAIAALKQDIATLFDEAGATNPSLGAGLIKELQGANREISGLTTGIKAMANELNLVIGKLRNLKIEPKIGGVPGVAGGGAIGAVSPGVVEAAAASAAKRAISEYVQSQEQQAKATGEVAQAAKRGAASSAKAARDVSAAVSAGEAADRERITAEKEIAQQKKRAAQATARVAREQTQAAATAAPVTPAPTPAAPAPVKATAPPARSVPPLVVTPTASPGTSRVDVATALQGLNEKALHAAVQQMNETLGTSVNLRTPKTDKRRNMGTIVSDAVRQLENVADEQVAALVQQLDQAKRQVAAAGAGSPLRGGPGGIYTARSAAEWQTYSQKAGFADTVERMGGIPALQGVGYKPVTLTPGSSKLQESLWPALERLQSTHPEVAGDAAKAQTSSKRTTKAAKQIAVAGERSAKATEELAAAAEQQAAVLEAEVAETRAAGTMSLADVRAQIQERVQRQRETELLDRNQKSRKQIDKIKDPQERETAIRQWETRQRQTASFESQALSATVIPYEGLSAKGSLDLVRTRLLNDQTAGLPEDEAIAMARRIDYATSQQRMQGLMATGRSRKRTPVGTMIDSEYAGYVQSAQEAAAAHTPVSEFQQIRQEGGLGRSESAIASYRELIQRAGEASIPLRDIESALRANARAGGQYRTTERGAEPISRANMEEVLSRGGTFSGDDERSMGMAHQAALLDNEMFDARRKIDTTKRQRSLIGYEIGGLKYQRSQQTDPDLKAGYTDQIDRLIADSKALSAKINAAYEELKAAQAKWDKFAQFTPSVGPSGGTKTAGAHTLPGPTGSIIPTPSGTKRGGDSTVGGVDEEMRQRLLGSYYTGYTEEEMRAKPFAELRAEAAGVGIRGRSRDALIPQLLERYPPGAANQEFGARQAGVFQQAGPARATYEETIRQGALEFLQQNPNWDPFAKVGTPQGKRNNKGPSTRRAIGEVDKAIEYWDKLAVDFSNYIASISQQIAEAGGFARAPDALLERLSQANQTAVATLGPNARSVMQGAAAREQYRAARTTADARPGSRAQRKTSADEMFFSAYEQLFGPRLGLVAPYTDQSKTAFGASDWRLRAGQVTGGFENYVSPLMRGDLDRTQMRKLRQATDVAAGTGDALHNFITTSLPEDFSGDAETLPQALKVELQRLRKSAQSARTRLDKLITQYSAITEGSYVQDVEPSAQEKADRVKEQTAAGEADRAKRGIMPTGQQRDLEARLEAFNRQHGAISQFEEYFAAEGSGENARNRARLGELTAQRDYTYPGPGFIGPLQEGVERGVTGRTTPEYADLQRQIGQVHDAIVEQPTASARQHIGELLRIAPTGYLPGSEGRRALELERTKIKDSVEKGLYNTNPADAESRLADIKRQLEAPGYEPDAFSPAQVAEARRIVEKQRQGVAATLAKSRAAIEARSEEPAPAPAAATTTAAAATGERVVDRIGTGSAVTPGMVREVTGSAPLNDVAARAADRMTAAIEKLEAAIQKLYDRFRPGQRLPEGVQTATGGAGGSGGGTRRPRAAAAEPPDEDRQAAAQLASQANESKSERLTREEREKRAEAEIQATASARRREILAGLPGPNPNDPSDSRANVRGLVSQAILPGTSPDERLNLLTQAGTAMRRQYGYRYKSEIPQLSEVAGLSREEKGVLDVRVSAAAKAYTQAAAAAKQLQTIEQDEAAAAERVAATQGLLAKAMQVSSTRTREAIQEVQQLIAVERERALTDTETAQLYEARVRAYAMMDSELSRINPDTRRPVLNQGNRRPLERAALGVTGPQLLDIHQEANARDSVRRVADAAVDETAAQGGKLRRAMSAMFGVNNSFAGRAIAGAGTAVVRTFSYGAVFGVVNEMQKIFRTSIETEAEFVRISDALNATGRSASGLRSSLQGISSSLATPLEEVYVTASQLTGVFTNTRDVEFATRAVEQLKLISRGALNSQEAISSLQAVTSAYGLTGAHAFQQIVDKATAIQNVTGANVEQVLEGAGGIAPQARAFHLNPDQALLYPGLIAQRTNQSGTAAAEQLSRIFESLAAPAASQFLTRRGFATETQVRGSQFGDIIQNLVHQRATGGLSDNDLVALERLVGARQARPLAALIGTAQQAQATERGGVAAEDSAGAGQQRVHQLMQQLNRQLQQLSVNLTNIGAALVRSGFLGGLQQAVSLVNIILKTVGQIGEVFAALGKVPGGSFLGKLLIEAGTLYLFSKLIGGTFRSISEYTNRTLRQNDAAVAARRGGVGGVDALGYPATLGYGAPAATTTRASRLAVINEQDALRTDVAQQLANQRRYSFFRNPAAGVVAGVGTIGARALDTPFIRMGNALQQLEPRFSAVNTLTNRIGSGMTTLGRSMTTVSVSTQVLRGRIEQLTASNSGVGRLSNVLLGVGNAALIAGPLLFEMYSTLQSMHQQATEYLKTTFPTAFPDTSTHVGDTPARQAETTSQQAIRSAKNRQDSFLGRISSFGATLYHSTAGVVTSGPWGIDPYGQFGQAQSASQEFAGSFYDSVNRIGGTSRGAMPLNDRAYKYESATLDLLKGLHSKTTTWQQASDEFDRQARAIADDPHLSDVQKTVAGADLDRLRRMTQNVWLHLQEQLTGIASINQMTAEQAGALGDVIQGGLNLTGAQRQSGIGKSVYQTFLDQKLVAQGSDADYYLSALYGTSAAVADPASIRTGRLPGAPRNAGPEDLTIAAPPSASQRREASLLSGVSPNSNAGKLALEGHLADQLEKNAIPTMAKVLHGETDNVQQYAADLAKFNALVAFDGQLRTSIAQESVQAATALSQILLGQGNSGGAIAALNQAIAAQQTNLKTQVQGSAEYNATLLDIAQKQRQAADIATQPAVSAAQLAGAQATNPGAQAAAGVTGALATLNELEGLRAKKKGGVTDADIASARAAVASANQAVVQNSESVVESAAALLQAMTFDPFAKVQEQINELNREIGYYSARGDTARVNELKGQLVQAQQAAADLASETAQAHTGLLIAIATAAGHTVQAAQLSVRQAQEAYNKALRDAGGNTKAPDVQNAQAAVVSARANVRDTWLQDREDDLKFQYDMQQITYATYVAELNALLKRKDLTKKQRQDIMRTLHDMATQAQGEWNIGDIKVPTPYEARRYQTASAAGRTYSGALPSQVTQNVTNNDVKINGTDVAMVRRVLVALLGPTVVQSSSTLTRKV